MLARFRWLPVVAAMLALVFTGAGLPAQLRLHPIDGQAGDVQLELLLRKLRTTGTFMATTAHPDDEHNALLALMAHGLGLRTVLVTATRGDGGQNEIGPEIFDALAVLRSEELLAAHRFDGAEQYFTRAVDFGFSFSIDEAYEKWGREAIVGDYVRHIRAIRPDVMAGFLWDGTAGGLHHQASTRIAAEAFRAAADPARYPDQIAGGLRPWQPAKFYYTVGGGGAGRGAAVATTPVQTVTYDPTLGRTYEEVGAEGRSMHRCQDFPQLLPLPGGGRGGRGYHLQDCTIPGQLQREERTMLDGLDLSLTGLVRFAAPVPPAPLQSALDALSKTADEAHATFKSAGATAAIPPLAAGLRQVRALRAALEAMAIDESRRWEIDFRLAQKERQFQDALIAAAAVRLDAVADDLIVTRGQPVGVTLHVANRGPASVRLTRADAGGTRTSPCGLQDLAPGDAQVCSESVVIPGNARYADVPFTHEPGAARYVYGPDVPFGAPFAPTPFTAHFGLTIGGGLVEKTLPIEARDGNDMIAGEKRSELLVTPPVSVTLAPDLLVVPVGAASRRDVRVTVRNNSPGPVSGTPRLLVPQGWTVTPAPKVVSLSRPDEEITVAFTVTPPATARQGQTAIRAQFETGTDPIGIGYQTIEYPHIRRRLLFREARALVNVLDVRVARGLTVGYVMGAGDRIPQAIEQLGVPVTLLGDDDLAAGDLSRFRVIVTGVRAYENRTALVANNQRLLQYVRDGGVLIVNYNRQAFNDAQYGPYPAKTSSNRVTDENAPVRVLAPAHPIFTAPNRIGPDAWAGWVQERGLYFLGEKAPEYTDLVEMEDPFSNNPGPKRGALVEARAGKGRWIYVGLGLWRELPAGVPGAYQLLANLLSLGAAPASQPSRGAAPPATAR
ncbi:MAG: PIG-L family deacetylase [Acidobacteria bacterium]|nr:PIG-L family deacetylase [Acidobacteriota bacterium]